MQIDIENLGKRFGDYTALGGIDLKIHSGELLALLGPSGSGKTTLLRIIAGLEHADGGRVLFDGQDATQLSVQARRAGFVFQHYALFRHMNVRENIAFGLRVRRGRERLNNVRIAERVSELLQLVQLEGMDKRYPTQLSGGQRQRVALARALAIEPRVLLLDEPFGALDAQVRRDLRRWLRELHQRTGLTTIFVTHDQEEALELADRVAILNRGRIEQLCNPAEAYEQPRTPFVYSFVGQVNRLHGIARQGMVQMGELEFDTECADGEVELFVRPEDFSIGFDGPGWSATVLSSLRSGPRLRLRAKLHAGAQDEVEIDLPPNSMAQDGIAQAGAQIRLMPQRYGVFPGATEN